MEFDIGSAAFWIALAGVLVASGWYRSRREQMKHETVRQIIEKTGRIDEEQVRKLFDTPATEWSNPPWTREHAPGSGYRALRILGALVIFLAAGLATFAGLMFAVGLGAGADIQPVFPIAAGIAVFGGGLFFCSRFLPKPPPDGGPRIDRT